MLAVAPLAAPFIARAADTIKIGVLLAKTGQIAAQTEYLANGTFLAMEERNNMVMGQPAELVWLDEPTPQAATQNMQKLVQENKVVAVLGGSLSSNALAEEATAAQLKILVLALASGLVGFILTGLVRAFATKHGVLDTPTTRSSHQVPTPRGGGLAILVSAILGVGMGVALNIVDGRVMLRAVVHYADTERMRGAKSEPKSAEHGPTRAAMTDVHRVDGSSDSVSRTNNRPDRPSTRSNDDD